jgi:hypothetical protein
MLCVNADDKCIYVIFVFVVLVVVIIIKRLIQIGLSVITVFSLDYHTPFSFSGLSDRKDGL